MGKHKGWSTWVILERQVVKRCHLSDLARFDRSDPPQTSVKYTPKRMCEKVMIFWNFRKIKKIEKGTFAFWHTCTRYLAVLRGQNRKVAFGALRSTLALPNRPSRTFAYVSDVFGWSGSPKCTFGAFGRSGSATLPIGRRGGPSTNRPEG